MGEQTMKKTVCGLLMIVLCLTFCGCATAHASYPNADKYTIGNFTYDAAAVEAVEINWTSGRVEVKESNGATLSVAEKTDNLTEDQLMRWWLDGKTLRIQYWRSGYTGTLKGAQKRVTVEIPKDIALTVNVTSGEIVTGDHQLKNVALKATSGEIELGAIDAEDILVEATSGNLEAGPLRAKKQIKMSCTSGKIKVVNAMADTVTLQCTSGNISAGPIDAAVFNVQCTSGDIELEAVKAEDGQIKTTSGDIDLGLYQCGRVEVGCTSGDVRLSAVHGSGMTVDYTTNSGSLNGKGGKKTYHEVIGDGASTVTVKTTSGDLKLIEK